MSEATSGSELDGDRLDGDRLNGGGDFFGDPSPDSPVSIPFGEQSLLPQRTELICPVTAEIVPLSDVDALIDCYERCEEVDRQIYAAKLAIRRQLAETVVDCSSKTRYVQGKRRRAKITMPDDTWDQSILKEAWFSFPDLAATYLRLDRVMPRAREVAKLCKTSGNAAVEAFRDMVMRARREPTSEPSVKVEKE